MGYNLYPCPACGRQVSPQAAGCPSCGQPLWKAPPAARSTHWLSTAVSGIAKVGLALVGIMVAMVGIALRGAFGGGRDY